MLLYLKKLDTIFSIFFFFFQNIQDLLDLKTTTQPADYDKDQTTAAPTSSPTESTTRERDEDTCTTCSRRDPILPWDGPDPELYAPLNAKEMMKIYNFLIDSNIIYKREEDEAVSLKTNYAPYMYLEPPNKEAALKYLNQEGPYPGRYANVHVARGNRTVPDYMEYKVGPLGSDSMTAVQLYEDGELSFNSRPYDYVETAVYEKLVIPDFEVLEDLTKESFDGAYYPSKTGEKQMLTFWFFNGPPGAKGDERETRFLVYLNPFSNDFDVVELDFLPLSATIHCPGNEFDQWYIYDYYYLNQGPFNTAQDLMVAYNSGSIRKFALPKGYRDTVLDRHLPDRDTDKPFRKLSNIPPPRTYEPEGPRYTVKGHHVDWMGWDFDVTAGQLRGPALFNIHFQEQSIAYEISLNDIGVIYGSGASAQTNVVYTDSSYGIGEFYGIVPTIDCPEHATLLGTSHWDVYHSVPVEHKSICVYEADAENALWRHKGKDFEGGLRNTYLVIRVSTTIDNYDYIIEWHFFLDGKIYTIVSASGYIQGAFWDSENPFMGSHRSRDSFGYKVSDYTHGQIHDHMFGFKVDLDILGTENTMEVVHWKAGDVVTALRSQVPTVANIPPYFLHNITRYIEYEYIEREEAFRLNLDVPKFWLVVNENEQNKWGVERGYQILPHTTASQILTDTHPAMQSLSYTKYHNTITLRKESEQHLTSTSDVNRFDNPIGDLEKKLNNEYIRNKDIVNWVTVGFLHLPTSEDVPMTNRVESGFILRPFNFFDKTAVFDLQAFLDTKGKWRQERPPTFGPCREHEANYKTCSHC